MNNKITARFTELVAEYMAKGMTFSATMNGVQDEIMKVDLTDGKSTYRIGIYPTRGRDRNAAIIVERFPYATKICKKEHTLWSGYGVEVYRETWYEIGGFGSGHYGTKDEFDAYIEKRIARNALHRMCEECTCITSEDAKKVVVTAIKRHPRCKTKTARDINRIEKNKNGGYTVVLVNGNCIELE